MGYRKDKTLVDEQELRRLQQEAIMQQYQNEAAKLPPEAAARLVDASYTLCKSFQYTYSIRSRIPLCFVLVL